MARKKAAVNRAAADAATRALNRATLGRIEAREKAGIPHGTTTLSADAYLAGLGKANKSAAPARVTATPSAHIGTPIYRQPTATSPPTPAASRTRTVPPIVGTPEGRARAGAREEARARRSAEAYGVSGPPVEREAARSRAAGEEWYPLRPPRHTGTVRRVSESTPGLREGISPLLPAPPKKKPKKGKK